MSERVTDAEAIAAVEDAIRDAYRMAYEHGHHDTVEACFGDAESVAFDLDLSDVEGYAALLALARDGVRLRALQERGRDCGRPVYVGPKLGTPSAEKDDG